MIGDSCEITDKGNSCRTAPSQPEQINYKEHWDKTYSNSPEEKLGWYETDLKPTLEMIDKTGLPKTARILNIGAGSSTLIDELLNLEYSNVLATDISKVSLDKLKARLGDESRRVEWIVDDLTKPILLGAIQPVDLWIDRAVLHFLTEREDQDIYFTLLKQILKQDGFVLLAEFNLEGAEKCAGLSVHRYNEEMLAARLGNDFKIIHSFNHIYTMPSGAVRPYIYVLFKRKKKQK
ncbi:MAG: class I SAM-dependent methyltransferase [Chlorobi bacterium]|nr:class I SAM-dependent methyltransferase [Chlorobiota bacterium]